MPALWRVELGFLPLLGRVMSRGTFCSVRELIMTLGRLSADGWPCVPALLVICPKAFLHWSFQVVSGSWCQDWDLGELMSFNIPGAGNSLAVQQPGLSVPIEWAQIRPTAG